MIRRTAQIFALSASRRVYAVLLAVFLNLAVLPCAMALEEIEERHDCCPPELDLQPSDCCDIDDLSLDSRGGKLKLNDSTDAEVFAAGAGAASIDLAPVRYLASVDPPDSPPDTQPRHKLFCIYLI
jgi:hypothetical protein